MKMAFARWWIATTTLMLLLIAIVDKSHAARLLSEEKILDYTPISRVVDEAALDLDLKAMMELLSVGALSQFSMANDIYTYGAYSASYAKLTLDAGLFDAVKVGDAVTGENADGDAISGTILEDANADDLEIKVRYTTSGLQKNYVNCQVGKSVKVNLNGCFAEAGDIFIGDDMYAYSYDRRNENLNDRTLKSLSTEASISMQLCGPDKGCPMEDYLEYKDYYDRTDFADHWISSAFTGGSTTFKNGNGNFELYGADGRAEAIERGIVSMSVLQTVQQYMMNAVAICQSKCNNGNCSEDPEPSWDTAVAYYVGSETKMAFGKGGLFPFITAEQTCSAFGTCQESTTTYRSNVNVQVMEEFSKGQQYLVYNECDKAKTSANRIINLTTVPLVQGTLRAAYYVDKYQETREQQVATMASFAASVLPLVHFCNLQDANTIHINTKVGASSTSFADVKSAFEKRYDCLGITCADVGGLRDFNRGGYLQGAAPCGQRDSSNRHREGDGRYRSGDDSGLSNIAIAILVVVGCFLGGLAVIINYRMKASSSSSIDEDVPTTTSTPEVYETPAAEKEVV